MPEEPKITMSEFKVVLESVEAKMQIVAEGVQHANEKMDREFAAVRKDIRHLTEKMDSEFHSVKEQIALLHEGQTEIKNELTQKVNRDEFSKLEVRVARLESKVA